MKAMIFAAGLGTRLKPLTNDKPKALVEINGKTLLERCILNLKRFGITEIVINVHHFAEQIIEFIDKLNLENLDISISDERNLLLDTGGGLLKAKELLGSDQPILIINVDILTNINFREVEQFHLQNKSLATLVVRKREGSRFLKFDDQNLLCGWLNEKTGEKKISKPELFEKANKYAFSGIHIIDPKLFDLIEETGNFSIVDLYLRLAKKHSIKAFIDTETVWMDLGKYEQIEEAKTLIRRLEDEAL